MKPMKEMNKEELLSCEAKCKAEYDALKEMGLKLDMSRGKPSVAQLDLVMGLMDALNSKTVISDDSGTDCRNYGNLEGLPEARKLMADMIDTKPENVFIFGNSSLNVMFDVMAHAYNFGVCGNIPWSKLPEVKWLCPVPGYDRHFAITELFGAKMIPVPMTEEGPDMEIVRSYVESDPSVKGIWCVPKYANPNGVVYSERVVKAMAALNPAAPDFRIFWDNAYVIHYLYFDKMDSIPDIISACEEAGHPDMVYEFCSTSKVSFPGAGVAALATSKANRDDYRKQMTIQTIGHDKINQLRHVKYFRNKEGMLAHMRMLAASLAPKFEMVLNTLKDELDGLGIASWTEPRGGYFISFDALPGCAKEIVKRCKEAGVVLTGAGATYPYGVDPEDKNIRIAPSYPTLEELRMATKVFVASVKLVSAEKLLGKL